MTPEFSSLIAYTQFLKEELYQRPIVKKIKVTTFFYHYLTAKCTDEVVFEKADTSKGYVSYWTGIPIEIDDTINGYYEPIY